MFKKSFPKNLLYLLILGVVIMLSAVPVVNVSAQALAPQHKVLKVKLQAPLPPKVWEVKEQVPMPQPDKELFRMISKALGGNPFKMWGQCYEGGGAYPDGAYTVGLIIGNTLLNQVASIVPALSAIKGSGAEFSTLKLNTMRFSQQELSNETVFWFDFFGPCPPPNAMAEVAAENNMQEVPGNSERDGTFASPGLTNVEIPAHTPQVVGQNFAQPDSGPSFNLSGLNVPLWVWALLALGVVGFVIVLSFLARRTA